jgi:ABC-2 type transport system ATP-binding protein
LLAAKLEPAKEQNGLKLTGVKTDQVGKIAFEAGIPVLELTSHVASLEEAFLELTADAQEYRTGEKKGDK